MSDDLDKTIKLQRNSKVGTDSRGHSVWTKPIEPTELELVSTTRLERILESGDESQKERIRDVASGKDGVLAHDSSNNEFEIVARDDVEAALAAADSDEEGGQLTEFTLELAGKPGGPEELSLVTTQVLRKRLAGDEDASSSDSNAPEDQGGYNPYDHS